MMCVTATGCSAAEVLSSPPQPQITGGFTADCSVTAYIIPPGENAESETEFTFSGQTKRLGSGFWSMEITSPETIAGLTVSSADDVLTSHLGDLTFDVQTSSLPDSSPLTAFSPPWTMRRLSWRALLFQRGKTAAGYILVTAALSFLTAAEFPYRWQQVSPK